VRRCTAAFWFSFFSARRRCVLTPEETKAAEKRRTPKRTSRGASGAVGFAAHRPCPCHAGCEGRAPSCFQAVVGMVLGDALHKASDRPISPRSSSRRPERGSLRHARDSRTGRFPQPKRQLANPTSRRPEPWASCVAGRRIASQQLPAQPGPQRLMQQVRARSTTLSSKGRPGSPRPCTGNRAPGELSLAQGLM